MSGLEGLIVHVELLYFEGCPNWAVAEDRLTAALQSLGHEDITVSRHLVETPEQAEELGFLGSPSIRIDGVDPFASGTEQVGLACRVYATPAGLDGSPTTDQLLEALS